MYLDHVLEWCRQLVVSKIDTGYWRRNILTRSFIMPDKAFAGHYGIDRAKVGIYVSFFCSLIVVIIQIAVPWGVTYWHSYISWSDRLFTSRTSASEIGPALSTVPLVDLKRVVTPSKILSSTLHLVHFRMVKRLSLMSTSIIYRVHLFPIRCFIFIHMVLTCAFMRIFCITFDASSSLSNHGIFIFPERNYSRISSASYFGSRWYLHDLQWLDSSD